MNEAEIKDTFAKLNDKENRQHKDVFLLWCLRQIWLCTITSSCQMYDNQVHKKNAKNTDIVNISIIPSGCQMYGNT